MYLLDTNAVSEPIKKNPNLKFLRTLHSHSTNSLFISSVTLLELRYGAMRRPDAFKFWEIIHERIVARYGLLVFDEREAFICGDLLARLSGEGRIISIEDAMIAGTALSYNYTLVIRNEKHFRRIPNLQIESWWD